MSTILVPSYVDHELGRRINITLLPVESFLKKYPEDMQVARIGSGGCGKVYRSGVYAVKFSVPDYQDSDISEEMIRELNFYASVHHPCILRPVEWSYCPINRVTYIAMPCGSDLQRAYLDRKITLERIVNDNLSAIAFLNNLGIIHGDIKPKNMIFLDGRAQIIDFGLAKYATMLSDRYYIRGVAYTALYKDPAYVDEAWNPINVETYALAKSYYDIMGHIPQLSNMYSFRANDAVVFGDGYNAPEILDILDQIFIQAHEVNIVRKSSCEVLKSLPKEFTLIN